MSFKVKNDRGQQGIQGQQGIKGSQGEKGETGVKGPQGEKGESVDSSEINDMKLRISNIEQKLEKIFELLNSDLLNKHIIDDEMY